MGLTMEWRAGWSGDGFDDELMPLMIYAAVSVTKGGMEECRKSEGRGNR